VLPWFAEKRQGAVPGHFKELNMPARLTIDAVIKMATKEAQRLATKPVAAQAHDSKLNAAIEQVWSLVQGRLGRTPEAEKLDGLIQSVINTKPEQGRQAQ
jgi:hypothetical protein